MPSFRDAPLRRGPGMTFVSRARCSAKRCFAEPGPHQTPNFVTAPALQRATPEGRRAALRPGNGELFRSSTLNLASSYPASPNLPYPAPVLSNEGALLEAIRKWDRAKAWPGRGNPSRPDAAPG